jgi:hypothetical protein
MASQEKSDPKTAERPERNPVDLGTLSDVATRGGGGEPLGTNIAPDRGSSSEPEAQDEGIEAGRPASGRYER